MGLIIMLIYSVSSWIPTFIFRKFQVSSGEIGHLLGLVILLTALPGVIVGGWITDRKVAGGADGIYLRLLLIGGALTALPLILLPFASSIAAVLACVGVFFFLATLPNGVLVAYIQRVCPPSMRGTVSACYVLTVNMVGYLLGPTSVGYISEALLNSDDSIGQALAILGVLACIIATGIFYFGRKPALRLLSSASQ